MAKNNFNTPFSSDGANKFSINGLRGIPMTRFALLAVLIPTIFIAGCQHGAAGRRNLINGSNSADDDRNSALSASPDDLEDLLSLVGSLPEAAQFDENDLTALRLELGNSDLSEILNNLNALANTATEVRSMASVGDKLKSNEPLNEQEKEFFNAMAEKYSSPETVNAIRAILLKDILTPEDYQFLLNQFRIILCIQRISIVKYYEIRLWLSTRLMFMQDEFESEEDFKEWCRVNAIKIVAFAGLQKSMTMNYDLPELDY